MIFALAGRRIDLPDAGAVRFPLCNVEPVHRRLRALFERYTDATLVCSAACGADLVALETAGALNWRRHVILPYDRERFRETSVTDRPGDWGPLYDRILDEAEGAGTLHVEPPPAEEEPFAWATGRIFHHAARLSAETGEEQLAVAVWEGSERGPGDMVHVFVSTAAARDVTVLDVSTLD